MHLIITDRIANKLVIKDRTMFLLGGIAPDAGNSKDSSLFFRGSQLDFTRYIDYREFLIKYNSIKESP